MAGKAKEFRYAVGLDRTGRVTADGHSPLDLDAAWTPEHLVLTGLVRCTLQSLHFHADPLGIDFVANASVHGRCGRSEFVCPGAIQTGRQITAVALQLLLPLGIRRPEALDR